MWEAMGGHVGGRGRPCGRSKWEAVGGYRCSLRPSERPCERPFERLSERPCERPN